MRALRATLAVAALVAAAALGPPGLASPAGAAACADAGGVTVVVDYHELGGGLVAVCDPEGAGGSAAALFPDNGFPLTFVQQTPGFVCRVTGVPADDPCVQTPPADAYWALFWSTGSSGTWTYASQGVGSLTIPAGGYVALAWQGSSTRNPPGMAPRSHASPTPSATSSAPAASAGGRPTLPASPPPPTSAAGPGSATPAAPPHSSPTKARRPAHPHQRESATATSSVSPVADQSSQPPPAAAGRTGGLPGWAVAGVLLLLVAAAVGITALRRHGERAGP